MTTNRNSSRTTVAPSHSVPPFPATDSLSLTAALGDQLSRLYVLVQKSAHVFGSPLGPVAHEGRNYQLPRFVYFGPHTSEESVRLSFLGSFNSHDLRPTLALLHLVEELALEPSIGQSLHLAFYPLIDLLGHLAARTLQRGRGFDPKTFHCSLPQLSRLRPAPLSFPSS